MVMPLVVLYSLVGFQAIVKRKSQIDGLELLDTARIQQNDVLISELQTRVTKYQRSIAPVIDTQVEKWREAVNDKEFLSPKWSLEHSENEGEEGPSGKVQRQEIIISEQHVVDEGDHEGDTQQEPDLSESLPESYVVHNVDVVATLKERQKLGNYDERTVKIMFQSNVWTTLKKETYLAQCMPSDEVKMWLKDLDTELIDNVETKLLLLPTAIMRQPSSVELKFVLRVYENFVDSWRRNPNPLLDFNMSEDTQLILVVAPILRYLFGDRYLIKFGETGLVASSFRRNQTPEVTARRRMGQRTDAIVALRSHHEQEFVVCELSGPPYANDLDHFGDDKLKIQKGLKDVLDLIANRYKRGDVKHFKKIKVFGLQVFGMGRGVC
ncbi:hypothetical protein BC936DRAFT_142926 [Jimgerdemannia flammicorona]|uniref:Uncharacterized protein n=1 Tax=Jimgerdemannia flammicorona TaxID=994334 RepID=A0A433DEG3_9FUNG|nr:hypothetical protein BC936DRAFT_142926 [Jimgerdemannia flammicorona]